MHNRGKENVSSARVDYWWSNPTTGVTRSLSTFVGSAFVDIAAGATEEALCLSPWVPVFVNGGHECLVAEVVSSADPLPAPPPDQFDPPQYHQVAQKNLSVLHIQPLVLAIQLPAFRRGSRSPLRLETGGELPERTLDSLGLKGHRPSDRPLVKARLSHSQACGAEGTTELRVGVEAGSVGGAFLHVEPADKRDGDSRHSLGQYTLLRVLGDGPGAAGITYVVTGDHRA